MLQQLVEGHQIWSRWIVKFWLPVVRLVTWKETIITRKPIVWVSADHDYVVSPLYKQRIFIFIFLVLSAIFKHISYVCVQRVSKIWSGIYDMKTTPVTSGGSWGPARYFRMTSSLLLFSLDKTKPYLMHASGTNLNEIQV